MIHSSFTSMPWSYATTTFRKVAGILRRQLVDTKGSTTSHATPLHPKENRKTKNSSWLSPTKQQYNKGCYSVPGSRWDLNECCLSEISLKNWYNKKELYLCRVIRYTCYGILHVLKRWSISPLLHLKGGGCKASELHHMPHQKNGH